MLALVDCNNFFASCERVFRPDLEGKPIVVLSNNDGCIVSRSNEAKALGIPMGVPYFKVKDKIEINRVHVFSSNFLLYGDMSNRVMSIIEQFSPNVEVYSIDEAFLDLTGMKNILEYGREIHRTIKQWVTIPVSVGIAPTKTLAKAANYLVKKNAGHRGVLMLEDERQIASALAEVPVGELWGIGRRLAVSLSGYGIRTAYDLQNIDMQWARQQYSVMMLRVVEELRGTPCLAVESESQQRKSIISSRSFGRKVTALAELSESVATHITRAVEKLREDGLCTSALVVYIKANRFTAEPVSHSKYIHLPYPTDDTSVLISYAHAALAEIFQDGLRYGKCGICLLNFSQSSQFQYSLFPAYQSEDVMQERRTLMKAIDSVNGKWGKRTVYFAACGIQQKWHMKSESRSPCYTTEWDDIPEAKLGITPAKDF
jgi:DNA polymerase V